MVPVFWCKLIETMTSQDFQVTTGISVAHSTFLAGGLADTGDCSTGVIETTTGQELGSHATQVVYKITWSLSAHGPAMARRNCAPSRDLAAFRLYLENACRKRLRT